MKHIMLLFLSEVHLNDDRTLSVSRYHHLDGTMIYCVQTNESAVRRTGRSIKKAGGEAGLPVLLFNETNAGRNPLYRRNRG